MFDAFWSDFKWKIFTFCFLPYLFYFSVSFCYITMMLHKSDESSVKWGFETHSLHYMNDWELPLRWLFTILLIFHIGVQIKQAVSDGIKSHIKSTQNIVDIASYLLNLIVLICVYMV